ncbi:MAG: peptidylprolyl isomerase [Balneolaceae bacterium]
MYTILGITFILIFGLNCVKTNPEETELLLNEYPNLYEAVYERDSDKILTFTNQDLSTELQKQAWKALISTSTGETSTLIEKIALVNTNEAWASLWLKELSEENLDKLHQLWEEKPELRKGLATVIGQKGNSISLELLLGSQLAEDFETRFEIALAIGRLSITQDLSIEQELAIIRRALETSGDKIARGYLYGFYRSRKDLSKEAEKEFLVLLENFYPEDRATEQYIQRILLKINVDKALFRFELNEFEFMDVQLAIEVAQGIRRYELSKYASVVLNGLLDHNNPNVKIETLKTIAAKQEELNGTLDRAILNKIGLIRGVQPALRLEALQTIQNPNIYENLVYELSEGNPYLTSLKYGVLEKILTKKEVLEQIKADAESEHRLDQFFALQELANWWGSISDSLKNDYIIPVKTVVKDQMKTADRSMIFVMGSLFRDSLLIDDSEYVLFEEMISRFKLPEDIEVYQAITSVLKDRFEVEASGLIDSLASENNAALNQSLRNQGWEIPESESPSTEFRIPDWKRLTWLGAYPILVIETNKGDMKIEMDVLNAPATISGIQQLVKENAYHGVPFHRVVPNFVIQGGDIETQNGFGGPDYVVPTEASPVHYERGKVGIASAGTDTEGSQFFIMHQWQPHLNGRYTIIGEVIEGMEVVDRIVQGDVVTKMFWQSTW